jgi:hypothetical protein
MSKIVGRNASLYLDDNSVCRALAAQLSQITLTYSAEAPDVTGFGNDNRQRLSNSIKDWELTFNAFFSTGASEIAETLYDILGASTMFQFGPSGSTSGCTKYTACGILTEYASDFTVEGAATVSGTLVARTGSITQATW